MAQEVEELALSNRVQLAGVVLIDPVLLHINYKGDEIYETKISIERISGIQDTLVLHLPAFYKEEFKKGEFVGLKGQFRGHSTKDKHLELYVYVKEIVRDQIDYQNQINLIGFICKTPKFRITPLKRDICDILIAVNRLNNKTDYLPCIAWRNLAKVIRHKKIGDKIRIVGRLQSREYTKVIAEGEVIKTAYEVSISSFENME